MSLKTGWVLCGAVCTNRTSGRRYGLLRGTEQPWVPWVPGGGPGDHTAAAPPAQEKLVSPGQECCLRLPLERRSPAAASQCTSRSCHSATGNTGAEACGTVAGSDPSVTSHVTPLSVSLCLRLCHWPQLAHVTSVPGVVRGSGSLPALGCPHPHPAARDGGRVEGSAARPSVVRECPGVSRVGSSAVDSCPGTRVSPPRELELRLWLESRLVLCFSTVCYAGFFPSAAGFGAFASTRDVLVWIRFHTVLSH